MNRIRHTRQTDQQELEYLLIYFFAVTWLEYCRYGVKHDTINQSLVIYVVSALLQSF